MKKYFIFAAIATAGLFASCSSSDDVAVSGGQEPIENAEAREAIRLNLAKPGAMITRGTGTVGGVGTAANGTTPASENYMPNTWAGQSIKVFMFTKGDGSPAVYYQNAAEYNTANSTTLSDEEFAALTDAEKIKTPAVEATDKYKTVLNLTPAHEPGAAVTYLYNNTEMITPGSSANKIPGEATDDDGSGEAMIKNGTINYYPPQGNFDFFGYHGDDAVATTATISRWDSNGDEIASTTQSYAGDVKWTVPFTITGTQDLMSTKAELTSDQVNNMGADANANPRFKDYFSAYAARKEVHPTLTFQHLLTRLQFTVIPGNKSAAGFVGETQDVTYSRAECDTYNEASVTGALKYNKTYYNFTSWKNLTGDPQWGEGIAEFVEEKVVSTETYTLVKVIKNVDLGNNGGNWEGVTFAVKASQSDLDNLTGRLQLYQVDTNNNNDINGTTLPVYVDDFSVVTPAQKNDYNYALNGARQTTDVKTQGQAAHLDELQAVKVKKIEVLSANTKGKLAVAWTDANMTNPNKIIWDETQPVEASRWLTLMDRPEYKKKDGAAVAAVADFKDLQAMSDAIDAQIALLNTTADAALITELNGKKTALLTEAQTREADDEITAETYALLTTTAQTEKYETIENPVNEKLIALTPTSPVGTLVGTTFTPGTTPVGESIILSPGAYNASGVAQTGNAATEKIRMKVTLAQNVPTNWNHPGILNEKTQEYELEIPAPTGTDAGFKQNTSYNIKLTVYGLERIEVIAVVEPWGDGGSIEVGQD